MPDEDNAIQDAAVEEAVETDIDDYTKADMETFTVDLSGYEDADENDNDDKKSTPTGKEDKKVKAEKNDSDSIITDLKKQIEEQNRTINKINSQLHYELRRSKKEETKPKDSDDSLSRDQLLALYKEHKDDPDTVFRLIEYFSEQQAKGIKKEAIDASEVSRKQRTVNDALFKAVPALEDDASPQSQAAEKAMNDLYLSDHPMGKALGWMASVYSALPKIIEAAEERGKKSVLGEKAEENRKKSITDNSLPKGKSPKDKPKNHLPANYLENVKQLGLNPKQAKIYQQILGSKANNIQMQD